MKLILLLLVFILLLSAWLMPSITSGLAIALLVLSLGWAIFSVVRQHGTAYREGRLTRLAFVRNTFLDVLGILLATTLALLLARFVMESVTLPISSDSARIFAAILMGLLVGIGVGFLVSRVWGRLVKTSPGR